MNNRARTKTLRGLLLLSSSDASNRVRPLTHYCFKLQAPSTKLISVGCTESLQQHKQRINSSVLYQGSSGFVFQDVCRVCTFPLFPSLSSFLSCNDLIRQRFRCFLYDSRRSFPLWQVAGAYQSLHVGDSFRGCLRR